MLHFNEKDIVKRLFTAILNAAAHNADENAEYRSFNNMDTIKKTFKSAFENQDEESVKPFLDILRNTARLNVGKYMKLFNYYLSWFKAIAADLNNVQSSEELALYREFLWNFEDKPSFDSLTLLIQAHNGVESEEGLRAYLEKYAEHIGTIAFLDMAFYEYEKEFLSGLGFVVSEPVPVEDDEDAFVEVETEDEDETEAINNSEAANSEKQGIANEQATVNMTEQVENELTVLEAAEQYASELREAESSGQVEDAAALRRADNSFTITDEHAADLRNWFYRTFTEFIDCNVDTKLLVNLYKMRLRATECTLNFEQYLRRYAYDLLMFNAGIVDESMPCFGDLKFINWLLTDDNAYPFINMYVEAFNYASIIKPVLYELISIFGAEQLQGHVEQSEEDLLMQLNYDEYTMKMITEARRKQLAS